LVLVTALPAIAQSSQPSNGGLTVCCGATFGYIGGSGSVSGSVIGPGGGGTRSVSRPTAPRPVILPTALTGGLVRPAILPAINEPVRRASSHTSAVTWLLASLVLVATVLVYRKLPRLI
jgi:hypothetical protein